MFLNSLRQEIPITEKLTDIDKTIYFQILLGIWVQIDIVWTYFTHISKGKPRPLWSVAL